LSDLLSSLPEQHDPNSVAPNADDLEGWDGSVQQLFGSQWPEGDPEADIIDAESRNETGPP